MHRLVLSLIEAFYMVYVVMICSVSNPNISEFAFLHSSLSWGSSRFFEFVLRFNQYFNIL
jgi:hypothetical protein